MFRSNTPLFPNKFPAGSVQELRRWEDDAFRSARWVLQLPGGRLIGRCDDGAEWVGVTRDDPSNDTVFMVAPDRGQWTVAESDGREVRTFRTLREALEAICGTLEAICADHRAAA